VAFVVGGGFYLLLIDITTTPELYAGLAATLLAAAVTEAARRNGVLGVGARAAWLGRAWRAVAQIPTDIWWVSYATLSQIVAPRRPHGVLRAVSFRYGAADDGGDAGRRALAEAIGSLPPNTIVLGVDEEHDLILVHQLHRTGGRDALDVLGLG
jgi:hypothetical protein